MPSANPFSVFAQVGGCQAHGPAAGRQANANSNACADALTNTNTNANANANTTANRNANNEKCKRKRTQEPFARSYFIVCCQYFQAAGRFAMNVNVQRRIRYEHKPKCKCRRKHNRKQNRKHDHKCRRGRLQERWPMSSPEPIARTPQMASRETWICTASSWAQDPLKCFKNK